MLFIDRAWLVRRGVVVATLCLALFTISFLRSPAFQPTAATAWQADRPLTRADSPDDRVALTFDVTWQKQELAKILDILDQAGVKATFFVGGTFLQLYPDMVKEIARRGHEVGTLGQQIRDLSGMPENEIVSNLLGSQSALAKILGGPVRYFRPPSGKAPPEVLPRCPPGQAGHGHLRPGWPGPPRADGRPDRPAGGAEGPAGRHHPADGLRLRHRDGGGAAAHPQGAAAAGLQAGPDFRPGACGRRVGPAPNPFRHLAAAGPPRRRWFGLPRR